MPQLLCYELQISENKLSVTTILNIQVFLKIEK